MSSAPEARELISPQMAIDAVLELMKQRGQNVAMKFLAGLSEAVAQKRSPDTKKLMKEIESAPTHEAFRRHVLDRLTKQGVITTSSTGERVIDPNKLFASLQKQTLISKESPKFMQSEFAETIFSVLETTFGNELVTLQVDGETIADAEPLFYSPKTADQAFDPEWIKNQKFHYGFWQIPRRYNNALAKALDKPQPGALDQFSTYGASVAAAIFHPSFGDGKRDPLGQLLVRYADGAQEPLRGKWFEEHPGLLFRLEGEMSDASDSPFVFLKKHAPELFERGLLFETDFALKMKAERKPYLTVQTNGEAAYRGVRYGVGRKFVGKHIRFEPMGEGLSAMYVGEDTMRPHLILQTFEQGDEELTSFKDKTGTTWRASKDVSQPQEVSHFLDGKKLQGQSSYLDAMKKFDLLEWRMTFEKSIEKSGQASVWNLSETLHTQLRTHAEPMRLQERSVRTIIEQHGQLGLEVISLFIDLSKEVELIERVLASLSREDAHELLLRLKTAGHHRTDALAEVSRVEKQKSVSNPQARQMRFEINRQATSMIVAMADFVKGKSDGTESLLKGLIGKTLESEVFSSLFQDAFKGVRGVVDFEQIKGLQMESRLTSQLTPDEKAEMLLLFESNWQQMGSDYVIPLRAALQTKLDAQNNQTEFHLVKKDGRIVTFMRFDKRDDLEPRALYGGSLNVSPELRGSAIGETVLHRVLDHKAKDHVIYADVFPEVLAGTAYVETFGSVIVGVDEVDLLEGKKAKRFLLRRDDRENDQYLARGEEVNALQQVDGVHVVSFDLRTQKEEMMTTIAKAVRHGNVATRYWYDPKDPNIRFFAIEKALPEHYELKEAA